MGLGVTEICMWNVGPAYRSVVQFHVKSFGLASFPSLHAQLFSLAVWKAGRRPGRFYHVMCGDADVTVASHDRSSNNRTHNTNWTERTNGIQGKESEGERTNPDVSRLNVKSVAARITSRPSSTFHTASDKSWVWRPGNEGIFGPVIQAIVATVPGGITDVLSSDILHWPKSNKSERSGSIQV